jgi:ParB/RepB/Spo0J family partition protein
MRKNQHQQQPDALLKRRVRINEGRAYGGEQGEITAAAGKGRYQVWIDGAGSEVEVAMGDFTVLPQDGAATGGHLVEADPHLVAFSHTNPRRRRGLDINSLNALAASIKAQGLAQPILVRPLPGTRAEDTFAEREPGRPLPVYELVCGERRLRACRQAGLDAIPMLVRDLTDDQALELQLVENIEREDLDPMEEAEGFALLRDKLGYTGEQIAERIGRGKGKDYVYKTMKLLALTPESREAMYDGHLGRSTGLLVARYEPARQADVVAYIKSLATGGEPAPFREVAPKVFKRFNLVLSQAVFAIADATLVPASGACTACPKRTGAQAGLFGDGEDDEDSCTDPDCFEGKRQAHIERVKAQAAKDGFKVIDDEEAKRALPTPYYRHPFGYTPLSEVAYTETGNDGTEREVTFEDALRAMGKKAPKPRILINPHTGEAIKVITQELADKLQPEEETRNPADAFDRATKRGKYDERPDTHKALDDHQVHRAVLIRMFDAVRTRERTVEELRLAVEQLIVGQEGTEQMQEYLGWPSADDTELVADDFEQEQRDRIAAMPPEQLGQVLAMAVIEICMNSYGTSLTRVRQVDLAMSYGIDILAVRDKVAEDLQAQDDAQAEDEHEEEGAEA